MRAPLIRSWHYGGHYPDCDWDALVGLYGVCHCPIPAIHRPRHSLKIRPGGMRYLENHDRGDEDDARP